MLYESSLIKKKKAKQTTKNLNQKAPNQQFIHRDEDKLTQHGILSNYP